MIRELLTLALLILAAIMGVARFRDSPRLDRMSLLLSCLSSLAGTTLLTLGIYLDQQSSYLVPLSLLIFSQGLALVYSNFLLQIMGLPLVVGELLLIFFFAEVRGFFASPVSLALALMFHTGFLGVFLRTVSSQRRAQGTSVELWSPDSLALRIARQKEQLDAGFSLSVYSLNKIPHDVALGKLSSSSALTPGSASFMDKGS